MHEAMPNSSANQMSFTNAYAFSGRFRRLLMHMHEPTPNGSANQIGVYYCICIYFLRTDGYECHIWYDFARFDTILVVPRILRIRRHLIMGLLILDSYWTDRCNVKQ